MSFVSVISLIDCRAALPGAPMRPVPPAEGKDSTAIFAIQYGKSKAVCAKIHITGTP
ncbi:hypothetical protein ACIPEN_18305 [Herbaspirillum chlorophenolicum]|uniref:Uncharacterized protein n=1 Tax=Herbaspirillum chlorophenolicum TaxID=211589 RepID=A0ABW8F3B2_9BURK